MINTVRNVLGFVCVFIGFIWIFQGLGVIKGSFMTGSSFWGIVGVIVTLVGGGLLSKIGRSKNDP
jgi:small-conductance mechanosensitive channel